MTSYVRMNVLNGEIDATTLRSIPPSQIDVKNYRWLTVSEPVMSAWESRSSLPLTVPTDSTSVVYNKTARTLTAWKAVRVEQIRAEQWRRIAAVYHIGQIINYYAIAIRLINKKASGQSLTAPETTLLNNIGSGVATGIEPISSAADTCVAAINNAANYQAVETAYASIIWP